jgi:predicted metalloprotease with PDZ domain
MATVTKRLLLVVILSAAWAMPLGAAAPVQYRFSFPEPQHRWMQVEVSFTELDDGPLELRMSRSSPGRYAVHDFAKNVYDVHAYTRDGRELAATRPDASGWRISGHGGSAKIRYKVYGDRVDGTYLAIDETHAHLNMPASIMWARGLDERPATLTFEPPPGSAWQVATQLHPGTTAFEFTAPNLQYLMDSPTEVGPIAIRQFTVGSRRFRFAIHHTGTDAALTAFVSAVEQIVGQEGAIFGEYPDYEPGYYTFIADYLPFASGDGMEHRNSTILTSSSSIEGDRADLLGAVAHEFFHSWNVERIRPRSLEPFDFDRANPSGELWLAEGFTQYYGPLALERAGLVDVASAARTFGELVDTVASSAGRLVRSLEEMSLLAPFVDGARPIDRTNWSRTAISYYPFGGAVALALDISLRARSDSQVTLDDYMRAMWRKYGRPGGTREGYVDRPYTIADAEETLAEVSRDRAFAHDFFSRYIQGRELPDFAHLLGRAGLLLRTRAAGRAWLGDITFAGGRLTVATLVAPTWPVYSTGLEQDDEVERLDNQEMRTDGDVEMALGRHRPGDRIEIVFKDRSGRSKTGRVTLAEDPHVEVVPVESTGITPTPAQRAFRDRWLGSKR